MLGANYQTKKELKENVGKSLDYIETSLFGSEYKSNGTVTVVGPDAYTNRKWFATVILENDLIKKVV